ncbi:hypothetical protein GGX14DRAFT_699770 [Mycena pura]|uniref:Uncharacterized protein n=1 Tax=Mycena pura TaxID=153505 RepID=A0AAD6Y8M3_9AGAR|nr:hypothetical protein GGX14DRAFT_699770 [Mycena pura]
MAAQTTAREARPLPKRRRLNAPPSHSAAPPMLSIPKSTTAVCASCHRASTSFTGVLLCSRCAAPTCAVCSRTCTASLPSPPPTPLLTWSPTPNPTPLVSPAHSPRRPALALALNVNLNAPNAHTGAASAVPKRKKPRDDEESPRNAEDGGGVAPGCGRTVCRECCFESSQESTTTCYDCYGR